MLKRHWETVKTILIFVLIASAIFLAGKTGYFDEFIDAVPALSKLSGRLNSSSATPAPRDKELSFTEAARPVYAVVTGIGGHHYGVKYDASQLSAFYYDTVNILGEALGSSSQPETVPEGSWRAALSSAGIYFDYQNPIPLNALTRWLLGNDAGSWGTEHSTRRLCISGSDDERGISLYYIGADGGFYRCQTAVQYSSLAACMAKYLPNGSKFVFEYGDELANVDPYTLIVPDTGKVPSVGWSNPLYDKISINDILIGFEMNPNLASAYNESGAVVYMMENCSLRLYDSGIAVYRATGDTGERLKIKLSGDEPRLNELLEGARAFASALIGGTSGAAELYFTGLSSEPVGSYTLTFDYFINGIPVRVSGSSHAAIIKISGGVITEARLCFRTFVSGGGQTPVLPDLHAAVLAGEKGGEPVLEYFESADGNLIPQWTSR